MNGAAARVSPPRLEARVAAVRRWAWMHPEWWIVLASAAAWIAMAIVPHPLAGIHVAHASGSVHVGMRMPGGDGPPGARWMDGAGGLHAGDWFGGAGWMEGAGWMAVRAGLMVVAMMLPLALAGVRHTAFSSLSARRHRAMGGFVAGFVAVWIPVQLSMDAAAAALGGYVGWIAAMAAAGLAAVAWRLAPMHQKRLRRCHATLPLAPSGWRADADCARYGAMAGRRCVVSCWAVMAVCSAAGHALPVMAAIFALQWTERARPHPRRWAATAVAVCVVAISLFQG